MKWIRHHMKRAMEKFTPTGYGTAHRKGMLAKVIARAYEQAAKHGIADEELEDAVLVARLGPGSPACRTVRSNAQDSGANNDAAPGGGGGQGDAGALGLGLNQASTTNLIVSENQPVTTKLGVSSESQVRDSTVEELTQLVKAGEAHFAKVVAEDEKKTHKGVIFWGGNRNIHSLGADVSVQKVESTHGAKSPIGKLVDDYIATATPEQVREDMVAAGMPVLPEGPQWPQKASVRVLGPCPNPRLWRAVISNVGNVDERLSSKGCSLETGPGGRWRPGQVVQAELVRGGGNPVYRAC
jgi:hypothetical protein